MIGKLIDTYVKEKVHFLVEVRSVKSMDCNAKLMSDETSPYCYHESCGDKIQDMNLKAFLCVCHEARSSLDKAYKLCRTRATEFLGFMISDLDREYNPEQYHAVPIAYALKGYSLPIDILRKMIEHVLLECQQKDLYTPVCCFDGQWCRMAVRDRNNKPLTILQLQKDTYSEVRNMSKGVLINTLCEMNVVKMSEDQTIEDVVDLEINGQAITVGGVKGGERLVQSAYLTQMIRKREIAASKVKNTKTNGNPDKTDEILSSLEGDIVNDLEENVLDTVASVSLFTQHNDVSDISPEDIFPELEDNAETIMNDENLIEILQSVDEGIASKQSDNPGMGENLERETDKPKNRLLENEDLQNMLSHLTSSDVNRNNKWNISFENYCCKLVSGKEIDKNFTKAELISMLQPVIGKIKANGYKCNVSSPKYTIVNLLSTILGDGSEVHQTKCVRKRWNPLSLRNLAKKTIQQIPKEILNCIYAEHIFPKKLLAWNSHSPFGKCIEITE
ncbi:MAG: hypothetical protein ABW092_20780 [Candidatus Thiodiazotropha sp.]